MFKIYKAIDDSTKPNQNCTPKFEKQANYWWELIWTIWLAYQGWLKTHPVEEKSNTVITNINVTRFDW